MPHFAVGVTRAQAKHKYLELVHTIPVYGCSFYQAQEVTAREVSDCVVGISERGVFSLHPVTRVSVVACLNCLRYVDHNQLETCALASPPSFSKRLASRLRYQR